MSIRARGHSGGIAVSVATDGELRCVSAMRRLAMVTRNLTYQGAPLTRRTLPELMADVFDWADRNGIEYRWPNGEPYVLPDIDDTLDWSGEFKWEGLFMEKWPEEPPGVIQERIVDRLRLIDLMVRVGFPYLYRHVAR